MKQHHLKLQLPEATLIEVNARIAALRPQCPPSIAMLYALADLTTEVAGDVLEQHLMSLDMMRDLFTQMRETTWRRPLRPKITSLELQVMRAIAHCQDRATFIQVCKQAQLNSGATKTVLYSLLRKKLITRHLVKEIAFYALVPAAAEQMNADIPDLVSIAPGALITNPRVSERRTAKGPNSK